MPRKTRKQKIAYQKRTEKQAIKAEEEKERRTEADKCGPRAIKLSIIWGGGWDDHLYNDVVTNYTVENGFLGFKKYRLALQSGSLNDSPSKSISHIDDTIRSLKQEIMQYDTRYVFFEFFNASKEFKDNVVGKLEDILCRFESRWDEINAKLTLPAGEHPEAYKSDIIARRYVN